MAAASEVGICNSALVKLGVGSDGRIGSLSEGTKNANLCNEQYEKRRDKLLRSHRWNFAIKRVQLARMVATPVSEFDFKYQLPTDYLRVVSVHDSDAGTGVVRYKIEGTALLVSTEEVFLRYVSQATDPVSMTADFREYLATDIAHELALAIAQSNTVKEALRKELKEAKLGARSADALEDFPEEFPEASWTAARRGRRNRGIWPRGST